MAASTIDSFKSAVRGHIQRICPTVVACSVTLRNCELERGKYERRSVRGRIDGIVKGYTYVDIEYPHFYRRNSVMLPVVGQLPSACKALRVWLLLEALHVGLGDEAGVAPPLGGARIVGQLVSSRWPKRNPAN